MSDYVRKIRQPEKILASSLEHLDIELTERCNNNCIHCCINQPAGDAEARAREMTTEQIRDILRQAAGLGCMSVLFTGGEPLL
ncbi:MAG: radical SAM protein, partial [Deltaproteobacteria bacterium]|nr:radical SAM protein [Deltaproteobacteria bacterium]